MNHPLIIQEAKDLLLKYETDYQIIKNKIYNMCDDTTRDTLIDYETQLDCVKAFIDRCHLLVNGDLSENSGFVQDLGHFRPYEIIDGRFQYTTSRLPFIFWWNPLDDNVWNYGCFHLPQCGAKFFDCWWDEHQYNYHYSYELCVHCVDHFEKWWNPKKFNWSYAHYLKEFCPEYEHIWDEDYIMNVI